MTSNLSVRTAPAMPPRFRFLTLICTVAVLAGCRAKTPPQANDEAMTTQPTPSVTAEDVQRIIRRDFGDARTAEVQALLSGYGTKDGQRDPARVHLAILKLAKGDVSQLKRQTETACTDYRDVLSAAEYRRYAALAWSTPKDPKAEQQAMREDWEEYQSWLARKTPAP